MIVEKMEQSLRRIESPMVPYPAEDITMATGASSQNC